MIQLQNSVALLHGGLSLHYFLVLGPPNKFSTTRGASWQQTSYTGLDPVSNL